MPPALVEEAWPELAAALTAGARVSRSAPPRGPSGGGSPRPARSASRRSGASRQPAPDTPVAVPETPEAPAEVVKLPDSAAPPAALPTGGQDLRAAVRSVLRADSHPLSGARIASLVQEMSPQTTREQVYDTLYRSADLFRKTNRGWELVPR